MEANTRIEIFGMKGEEIFTKEFYGTEKQEFSLACYPAGVYYLRGISGPSAEIMKMVRY